MNKFYKIISLTIIIFMVIILARTVLASGTEMLLNTSKKDVATGGQFLVDVVVNSTQSLNAVEGQLLYPASLLNIKEIRDGKSVINFWIEKPAIQKEGIISFSGITPGGFTGESNIIFSVLFEAKNTGTASLVLRDTKILLNDGLGTNANSSNVNTSISIIKGENIAPVDVLVDKEWPEDFTPILSKDPNLFDGKYFIVFATQDKISGIDHYEIREGRGGDFKVVQSPYLLENQSLNKKIFIKAIDKAGNMRLVTFNPKPDGKWYKNPFIFVIIIFIILVYFLRKKLWLKLIN